MPPERSESGSPVDWLRHARSDLALAGTPRSKDVPLGTLCFHAQQAVEKSIKAVLVHKGIVFPYVHDIATLITLLIDAGLPWPEELNEAAELTPYAVEIRYPGLEREVNEEEY